MFGHDDKDEDVTTINPTLDHSADEPAAAAPTDDPSVASDSAATTSEPDVTALTGSTTDDVTPSEPEATPAPEVTSPSEPSEDSTPTTSDDVSDTPVSDTPSTTTHDSDSLLDLKKTALEELAPLVDKLDQNPEEKFKTTMMMIQATDDSSLIPRAHEAANQITDEKVRAQALLDVVNEINYFTQDANK